MTSPRRRTVARRALGERRSATRGRSIRSRPGCSCCSRPRHAPAPMSSGEPKVYDARPVRRRDRHGRCDGRVVREAAVARGGRSRGHARAHRDSSRCRRTFRPSRWRRPRVPARARGAHRSRSRRRRCGARVRRWRARCAAGVARDVAYVRRRDVRARARARSRPAGGERGAPHRAAPHAERPLRRGDAHLARRCCDGRRARPRPPSRRSHRSRAGSSTADERGAVAAGAWSARAEGARAARVRRGRCARASPSRSAAAREWQPRVVLRQIA